MFCPQCGIQNRDDAQNCQACGTALKANPYQAAAGGPLAAGSVPNYLVQAILTTVCCLPCGIVAIVDAAQVNGKLAGGDYQGALRSSHSSRSWCGVAFGLGLIFNLVAPIIATFFVKHLQPH